MTDGTNLTCQRYDCQEKGAKKMYPKLAWSAFGIGFNLILFGAIGCNGRDSDCKAYGIAATLWIILYINTVIIIPLLLGGLGATLFVLGSNAVVFVLVYTFVPKDDRDDYYETLKYYFYKEPVVTTKTDDSYGDYNKAAPQPDLEPKYKFPLMFSKEEFESLPMYSLKAMIEEAGLSDAGKYTPEELREVLLVNEKVFISAQMASIPDPTPAAYGGAPPYGTQPPDYGFQTSQPSSGMQPLSVIDHGHHTAL